MNDDDISDEDSEDDTGDDSFTRDELLSQTLKLITALRPDHTRTEDGVDLAWLEMIIDDIDSKMTVTEARRIAARQLVMGVYRKMSRDANAHLRKWVKTGQFPIDVMDLKHLPAAIDGDGGKVRLGAMNARDLQAWMLYQFGKARSHMQASEELMRGIEMLIRLVGDGVVDDIDDFTT